MKSCSAMREATISFSGSHDRLDAMRAPVPLPRPPKMLTRSLLAVHWSRIDDVLRKAGSLSGKVVVTCSLPMDADNTRLIIGTTTSGAEELAKKSPQALVVAAFQTVPSEVLFPVFEAKNEKIRPSLVFCGDDEGAKATTAGLIRDAGFDPVDAGPLRVARYTEPFALLVGELAYGGKGGPELAYRLE